MEFTNFKITKEFILSLIEKYNLPTPDQEDLYINDTFDYVRVEYFYIKYLGYNHYIDICFNKLYNKFTVNIAWHKDLENYNEIHHNMELKFFKGESDIDPEETEYMFNLVEAIKMPLTEFLKNYFLI